MLAAALYATGIIVSALAAWLSRGSDSGGGPPPGDEPADEQPPPDPDGIPQFDWAAFEREFRAYSSRDRETDWQPASPLLARPFADSSSRCSRSSPVSSG